MDEPKSRAPRVRRLWAACLTAIAMALFPMMTVAPPAQAAPVTGFNPGNIISDALFYDGNAMTASEVQNFLNQRVPRCTIGDPGRVAGTPIWNTWVANTCLRNFAMTTTTKVANANCAGYVGRANESAAEIITRVAQACGISQRVLLITLEKEQSLVSDTWPTQRQFDVATGYACPDNGPGNSANCDATYAGFFNQVYLAAWQLKNYKLFWNTFTYKPFQYNSIQWHPVAQCGSSQVYIENWATAALYIYTPYRPNQAALNAGWGIGDGCSSYGNRNFYLFYTTWFGAAQGSPYPQIDAKHAQNTWLGAAVTNYNPQSAYGGGVVRGFENGAITWRTGSQAAYIVSGSFRTYLGQTGGIGGSLGWPTSDVADRGRGATQGFLNGAVSWTAEHGFAVVKGAIRTHYADWALAYTGPLGWPTGDQSCTTSTQCTQQFENGRITLSGTTAAIKIPAIDEVAASNTATLGAVVQTARAQTAHGGGFVQAHANGAIAWSSATGAHIITGPVRTAYGALGGVSGPYGWPLADQVCAEDGSCAQEFAGGTIRVAADGTSSAFSPDILAAYESLTADGVDLGRSLGNTRTVTQGAGGRVHAFEHGAIAASERTGAYAVMAPVRDPFNAAGGLAGSLGWPTGNARFESANGGGTVQGFEGGAITSTDAGTFLLSGAMRTSFGQRGGLTGSLGWPQSNAVQHTVSGGGSVQAFQGGALAQRSGSPAPVLLSGEIRQAFGAAGGLAGTPGWPTGEARQEAANGGGVVQGFQNAAITSSPHGTYLVTGKIREAYNVQGGLVGELGWPTSAVVTSGTEQRQSFQGGEIVLNIETGEITVEPLA